MFTCKHVDESESDIKYKCHVSHKPTCFHVALLKFGGETKPHLFVLSDTFLLLTSLLFCFCQSRTSGVRLLFVVCCLLTFLHI